VAASTEQEKKVAYVVTDVLPHCVPFHSSIYFLILFYLESILFISFTLFWLTR